jgi:hypothetical protein
MGAVLTIVGAWLKYAGAQASSTPFWVVMLGQIISGAGQPFFLNVPTHYSDKWFSAQSRVSATALMSLANAIGAAVGQLVNPFLAPNSSDIPSMVQSRGMTISETLLAVVFCDYCICGQCPCSLYTEYPTYTARTLDRRTKAPSHRSPSRSNQKQRLLVSLHSCTASPTTMLPQPPSWQGIVSDP